jgi:hypothetical protein
MSWTPQISGPNSTQQIDKKSVHFPFWEEAEKFNVKLATFADLTEAP